MKRFLVITLIINFSSIISFAQTGSIGASDARSVGMGKTNIAISRGVYSIGYNPANLIYDGDNHLEFSTILPLPNINVRFGTDFITIKAYNYFFGGVSDESGNTVGRYLSQADKNRLFSIFEGGGSFITNIYTSIFTASYKVNDKIGAFGFNVSDMISVKVNFPQQLVELALSGNPQGKIYNFNDADAKGWWLRSYSLSYSRTIPEINLSYFKNITAGITLKYVQGFAYLGTDKILTTLETGEYNEIKANGNVQAYTSFSNDFNVKYGFDSLKTKQDGNFSLFPSPAGKGLGLDFGLSAQLDNVWTFGLAITDIGSVIWTKNVAKYSSNTAIVLKDITNKEEADSLKNAITGKGEYVDEISTSLPTALRFGVGFQLDKFLDGGFPGTMLIAFDYNQGFNYQPGNSRVPRFSIGAEWKPMDWVPFIRTGFSFGGIDIFGWAFGLGINAGILELNFASRDFHYLFMENQAKRISFALDSRWKF